MKIINKILGTVISVLVAVMVLACCWQVITRFLLNDPSQWTEEFLRYAPQKFLRPLTWII